MGATSDVFVRLEQGAEALCGRLRRLGFRAEGTLSAGQIHGLLAERSEREGGGCALLLGTDLPEAKLASTLAAAGAALREGSVTGIAVGPLADAARQRLRDAGVSLALPRGFDDEALRFQVNRAFLAARAPGPARRELRAPFPWRATVRVGGRRKEAFVYNLSSGGAFLATARPSPGGASLELELPWPGGSLTLAARVVHTQVPGNLRAERAPLGMGVRFEDLVAARRAELLAAVTERSRALAV